MKSIAKNISNGRKLLTEIFDLDCNATIAKGFLNLTDQDIEQMANDEFVCKEKEGRLIGFVEFLKLMHDPEKRELMRILIDHIDFKKDMVPACFHPSGPDLNNYADKHGV